MSARQGKLTAKQEAFACSYLETGNASEAYRRSYAAENTSDAVVWKEACLLMQHPKVSVRIAELQQSIADKHAVTVDYLTAEYREAMALGKQLGQIGPTVSAITALGRLHGMIVEKSERLNVNADLGDILRERLKAAKTIDHEISA